MSPKELLYTEDALGHEKFLNTKFQETAQNLQDPELKSFITQLSGKHQEVFSQFFQLL
ncbi:MAG: hypothetical protein RR645_02050 [Clostridium sp.]